MGGNQYRPYDDGRRWTYKNIGYRRGGFYRPSRRRYRRRAESPPIGATVVGILALFGAIFLGGIFLALVKELTGWRL